MDAGIFPRVGAILFAGIVLACAVELARQDRGPEPQASSTSENNDLPTVELARCRALGTEAANDAACKAAWAKSRERFFASGTRYQGHPIDPFPATPDEQVPKAPPKIYLDRAPQAPQPNAGSQPGINSEGP
jgi:conjugative transfer region protein TrbK